MADDLDGDGIGGAVLEILTGKQRWRHQPDGNDCGHG